LHGMVVLWRIWPLLGNNPVNTFPLKRITTVECQLLGNIWVNTFQHATMGGVFSVWFVPPLYSESPKWDAVSRRD
jgi:hypothetical protein